MDVAPSGALFFIYDSQGSLAPSGAALTLGLHMSALRAYFSQPRSGGRFHSNCNFAITPMIPFVLTFVFKILFKLTALDCYLMLLI